MTSIFLCRGLRIPRTEASGSTSFLQVLSATRAASLNSAIGRGLRRSKGVGFRGREKNQAGKRDGGQQSGDVVRRSAETRPPVFPAKLTRGAWKRDSENTFPKRGSGSGSTSFTIRKGKLKTKVEVDDGRPPKTRSRAARFHDPDSSFGKKSQSKKRAAEEELASRVEQFERGGSSQRYTRVEGISQTQRPYRAPKKRESTGFGEENVRRGFQGSDTYNSRNGRNTPFKPKARDNANPYTPSESRTSYQKEASSQSGFSGPRRSEEESPREYGELRAREFQPMDKFSFAQERQTRSDRTESRPEAPRGIFRDRNSYATSEVKQPSRTDSTDEPPSLQRRPTPINRNIPLSIPYTTPASEFLYGTSVVSSALQSTRIPRRKLYKFYMYTGLNRENFIRDSTLEHLAKKASIPIIKLTDPATLRMLDKMSTGRPHNGYVLEASPLPRLPVQSLGPLTHNETGHPTGFNVVLDHQSREEASINGTSDFISVPLPPHPSPNPRKPLILLLDSILDPGNLGSIIRTASFLGVTALAISTHKSASFTPIVLKASAGASENITLFSVSKPSNFITESRNSGWKVYAGVAPSNEVSRRRKMSIEDVMSQDPLREGPCILMLGSEGEGLKWGLKGKAEVELVVRGSEGREGTDSLNVSVAAGILCSSFLSAREGIKVVEYAGRSRNGNNVDGEKEVGEVGKDLF